MGDVARLGLVVDAEGAIRPLRLTQGELDRLVVGGKAAKRSMDDLGTSAANLGVKSVAATRGMGAFTALQAEAVGHVGEHTLALGRLERGLGRVTEEVLHLNPAVGLLAESLGKFALGSVEMVAILGALALLAKGWETFTEDATKAEKATADAIKRLEELGDKQRQGKFGTLHPDVNAAAAEQRDVAEQLKAALAKQARLDAATGVSYDPGGQLKAGLQGQKDQTDALVAELTNRNTRLIHDTQVGQKEIAKITTETAAEIAKKQKEAHDKEVREAQVAYAEQFRLAKERGKTLDEVVQQTIKVGSDARKRTAERDLKTEDDFYKQLAVEERDFFANRQQAVEEQRRQLHELTQEFATFFRSVIENGMRSFSDLFRFIVTGLENLGATIASKKLGQSLAGFVGTAAVTDSTGKIVQAATGAGGSITGGIGAAISAHPYVAAGVAVAGLAIGLLSLKSSAEAARAAHQKLEDSYKANIATIRTLLGQASPLDKELADLKNQFNDLRDQAKQLFDTFDPKSVKEYAANIKELNSLEAQRASQLAQQAADDKLFAQEDLQIRLLRAQGHTDEANALADQLAAQKEYAAAVKGGATEVEKANLLEVQRAEKISKSIEKLKADIAGFTATIDGLKSFKNSLLLSDSAGLSDADKLAEAQRQYDEILKAAQAGDQGAAGRMPQAAQALLDAASKMYASGPQFQEILQKVLADTDATIKYYDDQRTIAQQQLEELQKILNAINIQTDVIKPGTIEKVSGSGGDSGDGGTGNNGDTKGGPLGNVVSAAGFKLLAEKLDEVKNAVADVERATKNGFEAAKL